MQPVVLYTVLDNENEIGIFLNGRFYNLPLVARPKEFEQLNLLPELEVTLDSDQAIGELRMRGDTRGVCIRHTDKAVLTVKGGPLHEHCEAFLTAMKFYSYQRSLNQLFNQGQLTPKMSKAITLWKQRLFECANQLNEIGWTTQPTVSETEFRNAEIYDPTGSFVSRQKSVGLSEQLLSAYHDY